MLLKIKTYWRLFGIKGINRHKKKSEVSRRKVTDAWKILALKFIRKLHNAVLVQASDKVTDDHTFLQYMCDADFSSQL